MPRQTWLFVIIGTVVVAALGLGYYFSIPHPTHLSGDPWDYTILTGEVPKNWRLVSQGVITPHDVQQESLESNLPISNSLSLKNLVQLYYGKFEPPEVSEYLDFDIQIITYDTDADAQAALAGGGPSEGWEKVGAATIGDESQVWHFVNPEPDISQNIYRVDFRFLNGIGSVTMIGTAQVLPNANEPLSYARKILSKMRSKAEPKELRKLREARLPDLRLILVSQSEIAKLDEYLGGRWQIDARLVPTWTPTDQMNPEAQKLLTQLGRTTGYQMFLVKVLSDAEKPKNISEGLFQQVSAYASADAAQTALKAMIGLEKVDQLPPPSDVGDQARVWGGLLTSQQNDNQVTITVHEIDFQVGRYVGSIRLQSRPLAESEYVSAQLLNLQTALKFAQAMVVNLRAVQK